MAFAHKVNRITIRGISYGGEEEWTTGFFMGNAGADANAPSQAVVDAMGPLWNTFFTSAANKFGNNFQTTEIKIAQLDVDGHTVADSPKYYTYPAPITGGWNGSGFPPQIALVGTLVGVSPRGLASKGRMFLPGINASLDANGRISASDRLAICTGLRVFLRGVVDIAGEDNVPILASKGRPGIIPTPGVSHEIISVRVGNVYDTQRRRRNALVEAYSTVNL